MPAARPLLPPLWGTVAGSFGSGSASMNDSFQKPIHQIESEQHMKQHPAQPMIEQKITPTEPEQIEPVFVNITADEQGFSVTAETGLATTGVKFTATGLHTEFTPEGVAKVREEALKGCREALAWVTA